MADGWQLYQQVPLFSALKATDTTHAVTRLHYDTQHELLWCSNARGYIASYHPDDLTRYTSFRVSQSPIKEIETTKYGCLVLSKEGVRLSSRQGLTQWQFNRPGVQDWQSMVFPNTSQPHVLLVSGTNSFCTVNTFTGKLLQDVPIDSPNQVPSHLQVSRLLICGTARGQITCRDPNTLKIEHTLPESACHSGGLYDMLVSGNVLVTCGYSLRHGEPLSDPILRTFDLRMNRAMAPFSCGPGMVRLLAHTKRSNLFLALNSHHAQFQFCDSSNLTVLPYLYALPNLQTTGWSMAPSGQLLAVGDQQGCVTTWSWVDESSLPRIHSQWTNPLPFADEPESLPDLSWNEAPLSSIGMPYYNEPLLSWWPSQQRFLVGLPPPRIPLSALSVMKPMDYFHYIYNTQHLPRGQDLIKTRDTWFHKHASLLGTKKREEVSKSHKSVPKHYQRVEMQYTKYGLDDYDFSAYNKTLISGLETHLPNAYCNALIQFFYFSSILRPLILYHITLTCENENCLCCELGFLFRMLKEAKGKPCLASNLFRTLQCYNEIFIEREESEASQVHADEWIQKMAIWLIQLLVKDLQITAHPNPESLLCMKSILHQKCSCHARWSLPLQSLYLELLYPKGKSHSMTFLTCLQFTFQQWESLRVVHGKCPTCHQEQEALQSQKSIQSLPPFLMVLLGKITVKHDQPFLTRYFVVSLERDTCQVKTFNVGDELKPNQVLYELHGSVDQIYDDPQESNKSHLVAHCFNQEKGNWLLLNDFVVQELEHDDVLKVGDSSWRKPCLLLFERVDEEAMRERHLLDSLPWTLQDKSILLYKGEPNPEWRHSPMISPAQLEAIQSGTVLAMDAEFIAITYADSLVHSNGTQHLLRPVRKALARLSVLFGGDVAFLDDYIQPKENIVDYLTDFSGIRKEDLDPGKSAYQVTSLKETYKKLRCLVDLKCRFVGHGLANDFRTINIIVPDDQVVDTVHLFHLPRQRKISLRYLAWTLLGLEIQSASHDSIEDARTAWLLYQVYLNWEKEGSVERRLQELYRQGRERQWRVSGLQRDPSPE